MSKTKTRKSLKVFVTKAPPRQMGSRGGEVLFCPAVSTDRCITFW